MLSCFSVSLSVFQLWFPQYLHKSSNSLQCGSSGRPSARGQEQLLMTAHQALNREMSLPSKLQKMEELGLEGMSTTIQYVCILICL
jgi:hypothetical protein